MRQDPQNVNQSCHQPGSCPTIGLFISRSSDLGYLTEFQAGVIAFGRERGANVLVISGEALHSPFGFETQRNVLYDLVTTENIDGLIITGAIGLYLSLTEFQAFCKRYHPLPMVTTMTVLEGIPTVSIDNSQGMREALIHLIETHGYRRIAFIRGPQDNADAEERYHLYVEVLADYGIPLDPELVAPGQFEVDSGYEAIDLFLDQRRVKFEALIAADDETALGALEALQKRGIRVADDIAIVGFDDIQRSRSAMPPLTTVRQPIYESGWQAAEMIWRQLQGEAVPERLILPTMLVIRQSCGCLSPRVKQAAAGLKPTTFPEHRKAQKFETVLFTQRDHVLVAMREAVEANRFSFVSSWTRQLLDAFVAELSGQTPSCFLQTLATALRQNLLAAENIDDWQEVLSLLRRQILPYLMDNELLFRAEDLWQQARVLVGEVEQQAQAYRTLQIENQAVILREISEALITTFDMAELIEVVAEVLTQLDIPSCYLSLYEDPAAPVALSRLVLAYDEHGRVELEAGGQLFPSRQLVPDGRLRRDRQYSIIVEALYFNEQQLGFVLFEVESQQGTVFEVLRGQFSSALRGALLVQQEKRALAAVEEAKQKVEAALAERARLLEQTQEKNQLLQQEISQRQQAETALQKAHAELEQRVVERTAELAQANQILKEQIVEREHAEEIRAKLEAQLRQSQKMEAIGQLAGGIAHDFNNLLVVIIGYSNLLLSHTDGDNPARKDIEQIKKAGERAAALTRQLLAFSRQQMLEPRILNLNSVVTNVETMLQRLIGEDIQLTIILDPSLAPITADPSQIEQIIINLAVNARDAMPQGGQLTLETANVYLDQGYAQQNVGVKAGYYVMLRVSDTGMGMDAATQARLFEPFFTTKPQGQGTGLGLATVFGIVQQSEGHVSVATTPNQGTRFTIYLPQSEQVVEEIKPDWVLPRSSSAGSEIILLVEDDPGVRAITRRFLEKFGYTVLEASHGLEALRLCQQYPGPIHLLITDVVMPGMSGRELVDQMASIRPEVPVLYVSGYTDSAIIRHGVSEATIALLQKPFTADALAHKVREMLDVRQIK